MIEAQNGMLKSSVQKDQGVYKNSLFVEKMPSKPEVQRLPRH